MPVRIIGVPMKLARAHLIRPIIALFETGARRATSFIAPDHVISVARRFRPDKRHTRVDVVLKVGKPNYRECEFIKACQRAGEPFPVKKIQLKFYPTKPTRK